jgi:hypothetical protein
MATSCRHFCCMATLLRCIDDKNRPDEIPQSKWVKAGDIYTFKKLWHSASQQVPFIEIKEIDLTGCGVYKGFAAFRFEPV